MSSRTDASFDFFANLVLSMKGRSRSRWTFPDRVDESLSRFAWEPRWSETGDRYIIKLFRDYVFHQVDESGNPVVNLSHVLSCLNKVRRR